MALPELEDYIKGVTSGDRVMLARAITLVESNAERHRVLARKLLKELSAKGDKQVGGGQASSSVRIGITGVPGVGKSSFIEVFGARLCELGHKVAVLAIDPSSVVSGGSILGDKTRMEELSRHPNAFIRPSPSAGALGGVARKTQESMVLCEAAGYDVILVETVGVGQSEAEVRRMVDFFLLLMLTGAGDELQSFKKGVIELADAIVITKADGDNQIAARRLANEFNQVLRFVPPITPGWSTKAHTCSAYEKTGIDELWQVIETFCSQVSNTGVFYERRRAQQVEWLRALITQGLSERFFADKSIAVKQHRVEQEVSVGLLPPAVAAEDMLEAFWLKRENSITNQT